MKEYLSRKNIPFVEKNVAADRNAAQEMIRKSGQMGVPVITVDDQVVVGFDVRALERLLGSKPPTLGAKVADVARVSDSRGNWPSAGAYIGAVTPGSAADRAGLQPGDVIVELDGRPVRGADDVAQIVSAQRAGSSISIVFVRDGQALRGWVTF